MTSEYQHLWLYSNVKIGSANAKIQFHDIIHHPNTAEVIIIQVYCSFGTMLSLSSLTTNVVSKGTLLSDSYLSKLTSNFKLTHLFYVDANVLLILTIYLFESELRICLIDLSSLTKY